MELRSEIKNEILRIIAHAPVAEDYEHALNVLQWVKRFKPDVGVALEIAALSHDIERAWPNRKVVRSDYATYDAFKLAHAENSAGIVREILVKYPLEKRTVERICFLVRHHELGGNNDPELVVLKDADSLSFFQVNVPHYLKREGQTETYRRMQWGYRRLSEKAKPFLKSLRYNEAILNTFLQEIIESSAQMPPLTQPG